MCAGKPALAKSSEPENTVEEVETAIYFLEVKLNGWPSGYVARFVQDGERLALPASQFDGLGMKLEPGFVTRLDDEDVVWLDQVPGLSWQLDMAAQAIDLAVPFERLKPERVAVAPALPYVRGAADTGFLLNYEVFGEWGRVGAEVEQDLLSVSGNYEARFFSPRWTASTTGRVAAVSGQNNQNIRLESRIDFDDEDSIRRLTVGDSLTATPGWIQPLRFGGVQWRRQFSLRPDIVTFPNPVMSANLSTPSTVDLFVNGVQQYSRAADPGVLELADLPTVGGVNNVRVVVTDAYGRRNELYLPLYSSVRLLGAGLSTFTMEGGFVRRNYGARSNDYGPGFVSGGYSYGLSDRLTLTGYGAAAEGYGSAGGSAGLALGNQGLAEAAVVYSDGPDGKGWSWAVGLERTARILSLSARYQRNGDNYRDLSGLFDNAMFTEQAVATAGLVMGRFGNLNLAWVMQRRKAHDKPDVQETGAITGTYGVDLWDNRLRLTATAYGDGKGKDWGGLVYLSFPLGRRGYGHVGRNWQNSGPSDVAHLRFEGDKYDTTVEADISRGARNQSMGRAEWRGNHIELAARVTQSDDTRTVMALARQAITVMDGQFYVSGHIDDGFTVVDVGQPGVTVSLENHPVGTTNSRGRLFVNDLNAYVANNLSIDPLDLPLDANVPETSKIVAPREGAGMVTRFDVVRERSAILMVRLPDGSVPPIGAAGALDDGEGGLMGYDGEIYLRGLRDGENRLTLTWRDGGCTLAFTAAASESTLPRLGPFTCVP